MSSPIYVLATKDFTVGPGGRHLAVAKGEVRKVNLNEQGKFSTYPDGKPQSFFGFCKVGDGWEQISERKFSEICASRSKSS